MYSTGTLSLTNGSTTVTGTGTAWVSALRPGWLVLIPSEAPLLVGAVTSDTSLTLARPYQGTTRTGVVYNAVPTRGELATFLTQLQSVISSMQATIDGAGAGKFPDGSAALPGMRFSADEDSGLRRKAANVLALVTGGADRLEITNAGAVLTGLLTGTAVTQSAVDATVGRLLKIGDFGLSGADTSLTEVLDMDAHRLNGLYRWSTASVGRPASTAGAFLHVTRLSGVAHNQIAIGADDRLFRRRWANGVWGAWQEIYHAGTILGPVSQGSGIPTGRVIERGSNANGEYVRFADGTQLCTRRTTANLAIGNAYYGGFRSNGQTWDFPAAFASGSLPSFDLTVEAGTAFGAISHALPTNVGCGWAVTAITSQVAADRTINMTATGRWF